MELFHDHEYDLDIYQNMRQRELDLMPGPRLASNFSISRSTRYELIEWMTKLHHICGLEENSLFLAVNFLDRILATHKVFTDDLPLLATASITLAAKYDAIRGQMITIKKIARYLDNEFTPGMIIRAELFMLKTLGYELGWPTPLDLLYHICQSVDCDTQCLVSAEDIVRTSLKNEHLVRIRSSSIASAALYLSLKSHCKDWVSFMLYSLFTAYLTTTDIKSL